MKRLGVKRCSILELVNSKSLSFHFQLIILTLEEKSFADAVKASSGKDVTITGEKQLLLCYYVVCTKTHSLDFFAINQS